MLTGLSQCLRKKKSSNPLNRYIKKNGMFPPFFGGKLKGVYFARNMEKTLSSCRFWEIL